MRLQERLHQARFASPAQEAMLNVLVTGAWLSGEIACALAAAGVTHAQYNVLRILRGSHPTPLTCSAIGERLIDRTPDVTRLLDRLERGGFLHRARASHDRRVVEVGITQAGLDLVATLDAPMQQFMDKLEGQLTPDECGALSALLEKMRASESAERPACASAA